MAALGIRRIGLRLRSHAEDTALTSLGTIGRAVQLLFGMAAGVRLRGSVLTETCVQVWSLARIVAVPAVLVAIPFGAVVSVHVGGLLSQVGAESLQGAAAGMAVIRQGAPLATGLLLAGTCGAAIAADLGARTIREEVDAMRVMGLDPVHRLATPRLLALWLIGPTLLGLVVLTGVLTALVMAVVGSDVAVGSFWNSFGAFANVTDLWFAVAKSLVASTVVATVAVLRGLEARGGSRGVADAVNSTIVICVLLIVFANLVVTELQAMFFPIAVG